MHGANWAALAVTVALFACLVVLHRRRTSFAVLTLGALALGIGVGVVFHGHVDYLVPIGTIYLNVLLAIVAPLVIISILASVTSLGSVRTLRTIGVRSVVWLLVTNAIAILLTLGLALAAGLGRGTELRYPGIDEASVRSLVKPFSADVIGLFPSNVVGDIEGNHIIAIILFALLIAISYVLVADRTPEKVAPFKAVIDATKEVVYKAVGFVITLTPYAVLALTAVATSATLHDTSQVRALLTILVLAYAACLLDIFVVNGVLLRVWGDVSPVAFFRRFWPAQVTAFTTQSSVGTLPVTTNVLQNRIGVPAQIAHFTAPLGTTIGMPGCAGVWPILISVYGINALGLDYGFKDYLVLVLLGLFVSLGTAGVPGTATVTAATVLAAAGLPLQLIAVTLPISTIADMARTMTNVTAAGVSATLVARQTGTLDDRVFAGAAPAAVEAAPEQAAAVDAVDGAVVAGATPADAAHVPLSGVLALDASLVLADLAAVPVGQCSVDDADVPALVTEGRRG